MAKGRRVCPGTTKTMTTKNKTRSRPCNLNLNKLESKAIYALFVADDALIGTTAYMGIAHFWNLDYKHVMRAASLTQRRKVHALMLKAGLDVAGESQRHLDIVVKVCAEHYYA